jgi:serine/threonine protein kinase
MSNAAKERPRIGPYGILAKIGEGGMGHVYLTTMDGPAGFSKLAVVKELRPELIESSTTAEMILNEVRFAARLTHPNVVHTYGAHEEAGKLYLATEYLDGQPWSRVRQLLGKTGALPLALHLQVLVEVLAGLHYAHELRDYDGTTLDAVHCDVSPHNVFVTYDGHVKIVDFGLARAGMAELSGAASPASRMSQTKNAYSAPEQARGETFDRRADVFAVGVLLWEALAGKSFARDEDARALSERRARGDEPRIRDVMPDVPASLAEICDRALAFAPSDRFATAAEFRDALLGYLGRDMSDSDRIELGVLVGNGFREEYARMHELIESELNGLRAQPSANEKSVSGPAQLLPAAREVSKSDSGSQLSAARNPRVWATKWLPRAGIAAAVVAGTLAPLAVWLMSNPSSDDKPTAEASQIRATSLQPATLPPPVPPTPSPSPTLSPSPTPSPSPAPTPPSVATLQLKVTATPPEASLLLDGVALNGNPANVRHAIDHELHVLRAVGPGLQSQQRVIAFDGDHTVTFELPHVLNAAERRLRAANRISREAARKTTSTRGTLSTPALPPRAAPELDELDYDAALTHKQRTRPIDEEDPYR